MSEQVTGLSFQPAAAEAIKRWTTAYPTMQFNLIRMPIQTAAGTTPFDFVDQIAGWGTGIFTHDMEATLKHPKIGDPHDNFMQFVIAVACTGMDYWEQSLFDVPTVDKTKTYKCVLFTRLEDDFIAGLKNQHLPGIKDNGVTATTTSSEMLQGISWEDAGVGTNDRHFHKMRQIFHSAGRNAAKKWPSGTATLAESTKKVTAFYHSVRLYISLIAVRYMWDWICAFTNSGLAISKICTNRIELSEKYTEYGVSHGFHPIWDFIADKNKKAWLTGFTGSSNYAVLTSDMLDLDIVDNDDTLKLLFNYKLELQIPKASIDIGRKYWGVGEYDNKHFCNLLIGAINTSGGDYDTHGLVTIAPIIQETLLIPWFRRWHALKFHKTVEKVIHEQLSYTYKAVQPLFTNFFAPFNLTKTFSGYCSSEAYIGIRPIMRFATKTESVIGNYSDGTDLVENNPQDVLDSEALLTGHANYKNGIMAYMALATKIPPAYILNFPNGMDREKLKAIMYFANAFSVTSSTNWPNHRFKAHSVFFAFICDAINRDDLKAIFYVTSTTESLRIECVKDPTNHTASKFTALKYTYGLEDSVVANAKLIVESRPFGEAEPCWIHIGHESVQVELEEMLYEDVSTPSKSKGAPVGEAPVTEEPGLTTQTEEDQ